jgi:AmmeMemoRadiSam system protein A
MSLTSRRKRRLKSDSFFINFIYKKRRIIFLVSLILLLTFLFPFFVDLGYDLFNGDNFSKCDESCYDFNYFNDSFLSEYQEQILINISRNSIESMVKNLTFYDISTDYNSSQIDGVLDNYFGCFVSLEVNGTLRGSIGTLVPKNKLYECVMQNSVNSAMFDSRFISISENELDYLDIFISVLNVPRELDFYSKKDVLLQIQKYQNGVIISKGLNKATYLPSVWDYFETKELFLESLCVKANLDKDCWYDTNTDIEIYESYEFNS